ncbi:MAG: LytTR family DNA-binding domain-containing protein [Prolixibacteraceae bacterium]|jgi:DNA-binding LytR/AlgR family response regulator|nr:LytTR family DNA-binding domain-containing protein [Prolixibacteraceae bacterium]
MVSKFIAEKGKLIIDSGPSINFIDSGQIIFCEQRGEELVFCMADNSSLTVHFGIHELSELLENSSFVRIGKAFVINLKYLEHIPDPASGYIEMAGGHRVPVTGTFKKMIFEGFKKMENS